MNRAKSWADVHLEELQHREDQASKRRNASKREYLFRTSCVSSTYELITEMVDGAEEVTREEFIEHIDLTGFEAVFGYGEDFPLAGDHHVTYWKGRYADAECYFLDHSRIEYIWIKNTTEEGGGEE